MAEEQTAIEEPIRIEVDLSAIGEMPLETLELMERAAENKLKPSELLNLLDGFVVGGVRGRGLKIKDVQRIFAEVNRATQEMANQGGVSAAAS